MERLQKWLFRTAICSLLFAIGSLTYVKLGNQPFFEGPPQFTQTAEHSDHVDQARNPQKAANTQPAGNDGATTKSLTGDYDWRDDRTNLSHDKTANADPWAEWWEQVDAQEASTEAEKDEVLYPPKDWYKTTDPVLHAEYRRAHLIKQFGDVPQVHTFVDGFLKLKLEIPLTLDEKMEHVEAMYDLFPDERTRQTIEFLKEWKASGRPFKMEFGPPPKPPDEFLDVKPFVERYGWEDGIAKFREINPARAAEFERTVNQHQ